MKHTNPRIQAAFTAAEQTMEELVQSLVRQAE